MADINNKWPWPANIGTLGTFAEEVKALQKRVERNPDAAPMPEVAPTTLLTPQRSSDNLRMGEPTYLSETQETAPAVLTHVAFRRILVKAKRRGVIRFDEAVETEDLAELPTSRREQMRSMLARERAMLDILARYNDLAESVYMRLLSESKG
jgi:hypothetical protein